MAKSSRNAWRRSLKAEVRRLDDLRKGEVRRIDDLAKCRAECEEKLAIAESKRLDANREIDQIAVQRAEERARVAAEALAKEVAATAKALAETAGKSGITTPLLLVIAAGAGGLISFLVQQMF